MKRRCRLRLKKIIHAFLVICILLGFTFDYPENLDEARSPDSLAAMKTQRKAVLAHDLTTEETAAIRGLQSPLKATMFQNTWRGVADPRDRDPDQVYSDFRRDDRWVNTLRPKTKTVTEVVTNSADVLPNTIDERPKMTLVIAIMSGPSRMDRRKSIRQTWLQKCKKDGRIVCRFFCSNQDLKKTLYKNLKFERKKYRDMEFLATPPQSGPQFLRVVEWATSKYRFDFLLHVKDDYFVCTENLLLGLGALPHGKLIRGYVHCAEGAVRVDQGFMLLSNMLIDSFLARRDSLLCHPLADQQVALWLNNETHVEIFHDYRVHHYPPAAEVPGLRENPNVCEKYVALRGSSNSDMYLYWDATVNQVREHFQKKVHRRSLRSPKTHTCIQKDKKGYNWKL